MEESYEEMDMEIEEGHDMDFEDQLADEEVEAWLIAPITPTRTIAHVVPAPVISPATSVQTDPIMLLDYRGQSILAPSMFADSTYEIGGSSSAPTETQHQQEIVALHGRMDRIKRTQHTARRNERAI